jgi:hypothetical protein
MQTVLVHFLLTPIKGDAVLSLLCARVHYGRLWTVKDVLDRVLREPVFDCFNSESGRVTMDSEVFFWKPWIYSLNDWVPHQVSGRAKINALPETDLWLLREGTTSTFAQRQIWELAWANMPRRVTDLV